jgi:hypothetical protein
VKVFVKGKGPITLSQANYVAQGGQASVFQKNGTAYKIYTDPKTAIPEAKFAPLAAISDVDVVKPIDLLVDDTTSQPIGYTMRFIQDTYALCQLFPKVFRDRNNIGPDKVAKVVEALQHHVENVHRAGVLVVDLNEMNILVSQAIDSVYMIDVDSYQTPGFRAEVIMPSVRDWSVSSTQFSELSDWFSFAVLVCQLYLGIHPYKGTHPGSAHVPPDQRLEHRMRHHVSVFDPAVNVPKACASPDVIPAVQREWLQAVLQRGKRLPPPAPGAAVATPIQGPRAVLQFGGRLIVSELVDVGQPILGWYVDTTSTVALLADGISLNGVTAARGPVEGTTLLGATPKYGRPIALNLHRGVLRLYELADRRVTELPIAAREIAKSGDRFYIRNGTQVLEVDFREQPDRTIVSASHPVANVLENASKLFDGIAIQNMLGSVFVSLFPRTRTGYQLRVPELDQYRVVDARFEGQIFMAIGEKGGEYDRLVFCCYESFLGARLVAVVKNSDPGSINFTVTDTGVCVSVTEDEKIVAYPPKMATSIEISDPAIGGDMRLLKSGGKTAFVRGSKVFSLSMKQN